MIDGLKEEKPDIKSAITLLGQYKTLCTTQEGQITSLQAEVSKLRSDLSAALTELQALRQESRLPSVKAAKRAEIEARLAASQKELEDLNKA